MRATEPLPLHHSWPLFEQGRRFDLGALGDEAAVMPGDAAHLAGQGIGRWQCDLADQRLTWSPEVYDIFGLPRDAFIAREEILLFYCEESRVAVQRLRAHAIRHRRGFTLDAQIRPALGASRRWMRLTAMPICEGGGVVRLSGFKQDVTREYQ